MIRDTNPVNNSGHATDSELGKQVAYDQSYNPSRLYPIPRAGKRNEIGVDPNALPFYGFDVWNHYEVSWLNQKGKPIVAIAEIFYDCQSPCIIESKSLKLYFNSLNNTKFSSLSEVTALIKKDLEKAIDSEVTAFLHELNQLSAPDMRRGFTGENIDALDIECTRYTVFPDYLSTCPEPTEEILYSDLLKSNCLVTGQPDWGSVQIAYRGNKIDREGLLRYLVSFRNHDEFHEQCIERIFMDILTRCKPEKLTVYGRYTRRGGIDINPCRSTHPIDSADKNYRLVRQ